MLSQVCVSSGWKKRSLKLNISKINSTCPKHKKKIRISDCWKDIVLAGDCYGISLKKGIYRQHMEDCYRVITEMKYLPTASSFGVFDGHSGIRAASYAAQHLQENIRELDAQGLTRAFLKTDKDYCSTATTLRDGTTACVAIINQGRLYVANIGDSKAILVTNSGSRQLSRDHIATDSAERERIESSGGYILPVSGVMRVQGTIAVTRSIGDPGFKEFLISEPHISEHILTSDDLVLILASDGLFDGLSMDTISSVVRENSHLNMSEMSELLSSFAIAKGSRDNITVLAIDLQRYFSAHISHNYFPMDIECEDNFNSKLPPITPRNFKSCNFKF
jgi:serine/threonine protein phosphatase PrpC